LAERPEHGGREADPAALRAGYERLRAAVLSERPDGFRLGHAVLLTRGMLAWIGAFGSLAPPVGVRRPSAARLPAGLHPRTTGRLARWCRCQAPISSLRCWHR
jgi:hypothetical protein